MIFPKGLKRGANVGLIAPASPVLPKERWACEERLREMGFTVAVGESLKGDANCFGYLAGGAKERAKDVNQMFLDAQVEAIFCVRGGYGSFQILPYLDYGCICENPKIFVGFSDITALHTVFQRYCNLVTFHGPMVRPNFLGEPDGYTLEGLLAVCNLEQEVEFVNPPGEGLKVIREGEAEGILLGGNLSVLARSLGTAFGPVSEESILFLEDVGESIPRIHMYLTQMQYGGVFAGVKGVLLGDFTDCTNVGYEESLTAEEFLRGWFGKMGIPVIGNVCSDHRSLMGTLPLGARCKMKAQGEGTAKIVFYR